jgi:hypothetical protein
MKATLNSGRREHMSLVWEELSARGPVTCCWSRTRRSGRPIVPMQSRGETGIANFMDVQASRGIAWHVRGPIPADHGLVQRINLITRKNKLGLRIVEEIHNVDEAWPHPRGRAIAYGKVAPILHLAGWIGSERQLSRSALDSVLFWVRLGSRVSMARGLALDRGEYNKGKAICDSPTPAGWSKAPKAGGAGPLRKIPKIFFCPMNVR